MEMYLHDSATIFRFVLVGELRGVGVQDLEQAWITVQSILNGKEVVIDVTGLTDADEFGVGLLLRLKESGARLTRKVPTKSAQVLRSLGLSVPPGPERSRRGVLQFWRPDRARR